LGLASVEERALRVRDSSFVIRHRRINFFKVRATFFSLSFLPLPSLLPATGALASL
jgi:hypothetical protein